MFKQMIGSPNYIPPEMALGNGYNEKVDIWACGVIFHLFLTGKFPIDGKNDAEILRKIRNAPPINVKQFSLYRFDAMALDLLKKLLCKNPRERPSAYQALEHPYFTKNNEVQEEVREVLEQFILFSYYGPLQRDILRFYYLKIQPKYEKERYKNLFFRLNKSATGLLTEEELLNAFREAKLTWVSQDMIIDMFAKIDLDAGGTADFEEFIITMILKEDFLRDSRI